MVLNDAPTGPIFHVDGDRFVPTELARGPWDPGAQHGGAPAALVSRAVERCDAPGPMQVVRLTIEFLRPIPLAALELSTRVTRPGRKLQLVEVVVRTGDAEVARAAAVRVRRKALALDGAAPPADPPPPMGTEVAFLAEGDEERPTMFGDAFELRSERAWHEPGPGAFWFRLRVPVVGGEEPSPLMRAAAVADFGNGISAVVPWHSGWLFVNADLTLSLSRPPRGEWVGSSAVTWCGADGAGISDAALYDEGGRIGRATQSLFLDRE